MLFAIVLQLTSLLPAPQQVESLMTRSGNLTAYQQQILDLALQESYSQQQILDLRPQKHQQSEVAALLPYATATQAKLIAVLSSGSAADSVLSDALLQLAVRSRNLDVRLACLLAPIAVDASYLPVLACLALSSDLDLSLRAVSCARLLEHQYYSAWPLAKAILLTGTATDFDNGHAFPDWKRSGRYELPKRLLTMLLEAAVLEQNGTTIVFEPNAAWAVQEQQVAAIDKMMAGLTSTNNDNQRLSSFKKLDRSMLSLAPLAKKLLAY
jgi:hypothetical protein